MRGMWILAAALLVSACGRYFHTPLEPAAEQAPGMTVNDDGSITYDLDRLAITLKPMTDAELNRLLSPSGDYSTNPYTFGDLEKPGDGFTPQRFTVFRLQVANYQYPKVLIDPMSSQIRTANQRQYAPLSYAELYKYYQAHWQGRTGQGRVEFRNRTDVLKRTLYVGNMVFSGSDEEGYIVFPLLADDVSRIEVDLQDIAVRFDYADNPVETIDLTFAFERDILRGFRPADATSVD